LGIARVRQLGCAGVSDGLKYWQVMIQNVDSGLKFSHFGGVAGGGRWDWIAAG